MPGGDRTGPMGMGPMTGRGAGFCAGYGVPGVIRGGFFGGRGHGRGGRWRNRYYATGLTGWQRAAMSPAVGAMPAQDTSATPVPEEVELQSLRAQAETAAATLDQVRRRIDEIAAAKPPRAESPEKS